MNSRSIFIDFRKARRGQNLNSAARPKGEPTGFARRDDDLTFDRLTGVMVSLASIHIGNAPCGPRRCGAKA